MVGPEQQMGQRAAPSLKTLKVQPCASRELELAGPSSDLLPVRFMFSLKRVQREPPAPGLVEPAQSSSVPFK